MAVDGLSICRRKPMGWGDGGVVALVKKTNIMVIENNALWKGARGSLGGLVFQTVGDKVIVRTEPRVRKVPVEKQSELQRRTRMNFKEAAAFAKMVTRDKARKAYYAQLAKVIGVRSAYSAAISEFMRGQGTSNI